MMRDARNPRAGNTVLEFTLIGIPLIFVLISTFEMARGMWLYHTLAHAAKEGARLAAVRGKYYAENLGAHPAPSVREIARRVQFAAVGLDPAEVRMTLLSGSVSSPHEYAPAYEKRLSNYLLDTSVWPAEPFNRPGEDLVGVEASYPFCSAIAMFWPGTAGVAVFPTFQLPASAREEIQF